MPTPKKGKYKLTKEKTKKGPNILLNERLKKVTLRKAGEKNKIKIKKIKNQMKQEIYIPYILFRISEVCLEANYSIKINAVTSPVGQGDALVVDPHKLGVVEEHDGEPGQVHHLQHPEQ